MINSLSDDPLLQDVPEVEGYKVLSPCVLYSKVGQGGMGAVYRGKHLNLEIDVAVKCLKRALATESVDFVQRFQREARLAASIHHQNLVQVYDVSQQKGVHYLVMEFVCGETARDRVARKGALSANEALRILFGAALGLEEAHRNRIVHRDVKPDNILISQDGRVKVSDLGLAKAFETESGPALTQGVMGTPQYIAPEQWDDAAHVGAQADVWALGATLYFLLTGTDAIPPGSMNQVCRRICIDPFPDVRAKSPGVPAAIVRILDRCVARRLEDRYPDCRELVRDLEVLLAMDRTSLAFAESEQTRARAMVSPPPPESLVKIRVAIDTGFAQRMQTGERTEVLMGRPVPGTPPVATPGASPRPATAAPDLAATHDSRRRPLVWSLSAAGLAIVLVPLLYLIVPRDEVQADTQPRPPNAQGTIRPSSSAPKLSFSTTETEVATREDRWVLQGTWDGEVDSSAARPSFAVKLPTGTPGPEPQFEPWRGGFSATFPLATEGLHQIAIGAPGLDSPRTFYVRRDTQAPTLRVTDPGSESQPRRARRGQVLDVAFEAADREGSGLARISIAIDGGIPATKTPEEAGEFVRGEVEHLDLGTHRIEFIAEDKAGNQSSPSKAWLRVVSPTLSLSSAGERLYTQGREVQLEGTLEDWLTPHVTLRCVRAEDGRPTTDKGAPDAVARAAADGTFTHVLPLAQEGEYVVTASAEGVERSMTRVVFVDRTAPSVDFVEVGGERPGPGAYRTKENALAVTIRVTDELSGVSSVAIEQHPDVPLSHDADADSWSGTIPLPDPGSSSITVAARDNAGLIRTASLEIVVDRAPPQNVAVEVRRHVPGQDSALCLADVSLLPGEYDVLFMFDEDVQSPDLQVSQGADRAPGTSSRPAVRVAGSGAPAKEVHVLITVLEDEQPIAFQLTFADDVGNSESLSWSRSVSVPPKLPAGWEGLEASQSTRGTGFWVTPARDPRTGIVFVLVKLADGRQLYVAETEVTFEQWQTGQKLNDMQRKVADGHAAELQAESIEPHGMDLPVVWVSAKDAEKFCQQFGYRLPTVSEWRQACTGSADSRWGFESASAKVAAVLAEHAWFGENAGDKLHCVRGKKDLRGFFDTYGNAAELCRSDDDKGAYVRIGGHFRSKPNDCRDPQSNSGKAVEESGFRAVVDPREP